MKKLIIATALLATSFASHAGLFSVPGSDGIGYSDDHGAAVSSETRQVERENAVDNKRIEAKHYCIHMVWKYAAEAFARQELGEAKPYKNLEGFTDEDMVNPDVRANIVAECVNDYVKKGLKDTIYE